MVNDRQDLTRAYVVITRHVVDYIVRQLNVIVTDAWDVDDETGVLDRMNPELEEFEWMNAVIRFVSTVRNILQQNLDNPISGLIVAASLLEDPNGENNPDHAN